MARRRVIVHWKAGSIARPLEAEPRVCTLSQIPYENNIPCEECITAFESEDEMIDFINDIGKQVYAD
jgi:hypothetical protein